MPTAQVDCTPGIDWITLSSDEDGPSDQLYRTVRALQAEHEGEGNRRRDWGMRGYIGHAVRHCRYGVKGDSVLVELSGDLADRHWLELVELATGISRLDTKVDVTFPHDVIGLAEDAYHAPGVPLGPNLPAIQKTLYTGNAGGQTCYVGAMGGRRLGRLYDKHAESRGEYPPNTWRWELQERSPFSGLTGGALRRVDNVPRSIAAHVSAFYARHGITPWFKADRIALPTLARSRRTDLSTYCAWLRSQVAPGMRRWLDRGCGDALAVALGVVALEARP
jgi:hypothetical protein